MQVAMLTMVWRDLTKPSCRLTVQTVLLHATQNEKPPNHLWGTSRLPYIHPSGIMNGTYLPTDPANTTLHGHHEQTYRSCMRTQCTTVPSLEQFGKDLMFMDPGRVYCKYIDQKFTTIPLQTALVSCSEWHL